MDSRDISDIIKKIESEKSIFAQKAYLDPLSSPAKIVGRKKEAEEMIRMLLGHRQGYVVPFVSIYGRSGCGKSVVTRYVCENIGDLSFVFVNLREAKTIFGASNLILGELGMPSLKSAQGINQAIDNIEKAIRSKLASSKKLFVLVLDEFDVIFLDKRSKPSDFVYKLVLLAEKLRHENLLLCIISISNNVLSEYELDDRVKSRIGSSEIFFAPYSKNDILDILAERAKVAFAKKVDDIVLEHCAELGSSEHGDVRRAIDLLRVASELASVKGETLSKKHVDLASEELQKDRAEKIISKSSYHFRLACGSLARITYLTGESLHSTSTIYKQYCLLLEKGKKPLSYRRVSDLLVEVANTGLAESKTLSRGRNGYGTEYRLAMPPEMVGRAVSKEWWENIEKSKAEHDASVAYSNAMGSMKSSLAKNLAKVRDMQWKRQVGL